MISGGGAKRANDVEHQQHWAAWRRKVRQIVLQEKMAHENVHKDV